jgi:hypothetical protein
MHKWSINRVTNPNPVYSHSFSWQYLINFSNKTCAHDLPISCGSSVMVITSKAKYIFCATDILLFYVFKKCALNKICIRLFYKTCYHIKVQDITSGADGIAFISGICRVVILMLIVGI